MRTVPSINLKQIKEVERELDELLEIEETKWRQRSIIEWLRADDRNNGFLMGKLLFVESVIVFCSPILKTSLK